MERMKAELERQKTGAGKLYDELQNAFSELSRQEEAAESMRRQLEEKTALEARLREQKEEAERRCGQQHSIMRQYQRELKLLRQQMIVLKQENAQLRAKGAAGRETASALRAGLESVMRHVTPVMDVKRRSTGEPEGRDIKNTVPVGRKKAPDGMAAAREEIEPVFTEEPDGGAQHYRKHVNEVKQTIADAQQRIARMLEELQADVDPFEA